MKLRRSSLGHLSLLSLILCEPVAALALPPQHSSAPIQQTPPALPLPLARLAAERYLLAHRLALASGRDPKNDCAVAKARGELELHLHKAWEAVAKVTPVKSGEGIGPEQERAWLRVTGLTAAQADLLMRQGVNRTR